MAISFPNPNDTQEITHNGVTYAWDAVKGSWNIVTPTVGDFVDQSYVDTLYETAAKRITHNQDLINGLGKVTAEGTFTLSDTTASDNVYVSNVSGDISGGEEALDAKLAYRQDWVDSALTESITAGQFGGVSYDGSFNDVMAIVVNNTDKDGNDLGLGDAETLMVGGEVEIYKLTDAQYGTNLDFYCIATIDTVSNSGNRYGLTLRNIHGVGNFKQNGGLMGEDLRLVFHSGVSVATTGDLEGYVPTEGGTITGDLVVNGILENAILSSDKDKPGFVLRGQTTVTSDMKLDGGIDHGSDGTKSNGYVLALQNEPNYNFSSFVGYYGKRTEPYSLAIQKDLDLCYKLENGNQTGYPFTFRVGNESSTLSVDGVLIQYQAMGGSAKPINIKKSNTSIFHIDKDGTVFNGTKTPGSNNRQLVDVEYFDENKYNPGDKMVADSPSGAETGGFYYVNDTLYFKAP